MMMWRNLDVAALIRLLRSLAGRSSAAAPLPTKADQ